MSCMRQVLAAAAIMFHFTAARLSLCDEAPLQFLPNPS